MTHFIIEKPGVDIYTCPQPDITHATEISIGDLHANAMLMMYFLVTNGVFKISEERYAHLTDIYLKKQLIESDINAFNTIIDELEMGEKPRLRFIGDEICDRGQNDYFIFKILDKLRKSGVQTEILLSNHGIEFMIPYEKKQRLCAPNIDFYDQARSLNNMRALVDNGVISEKEVDAFVKNSYLPSLKLISYTLDGNDITIYSHAGIGLETIRSLAEKFKKDGIVYKDDTAMDLASTIDAMNRVFYKHVQAGTVNTLATNISNSSDYTNDPVTFLIWNRGYHHLSREQKHNGYQMFYAHGHDSGELTQKNIINLDHPLGKGLDYHKGTYRVLGVQGGPVVQRQALADEKMEDVGSDKDDFNVQLSKLESKAQRLRKDGHQKAYDSAINIHTTVTNAFIQLRIDRDYPTFNQTCMDVIAKERPRLDQHRGWSELLINLAIAIPTAGIGLLVKGAINLSHNKSFFFVHKTASSIIVDEVLDDLQRLP